MNNIIQVGCGEYHTAYLQNNGKVYATLWDGGNHKYMEYPGIENVVGVTGGQYSSLCWTKDGTAYELFKNSQGGPTSKKIALSDPIIYCQMFNQAKLLIDKDGDVFYLAETADKDTLKYKVSAKPTPLMIGYGITKIAVGEEQYGILLLTKEGKVLKWEKGGKEPAELAVVGTVTDIAMIGRGVYIAVMANVLMAWGTRCSYVGLSAQVTKPTPLNTPMIKWPLKSIVGNWNTLHIIDANDDMWAIGDTIMGEAGIGLCCKDWKNYKSDTGSLQPYAWNWLPAQMLTDYFVKMDGKWTDVFTSGSMAFYHYAIATDGKLYSWGRNKERALGNGRTLIDNGLSAKYPNWEDVPYPTEVSPDSVKWTIINNFDPASAPNNAPWKPIPPPIPEKNIIAMVSTAGWSWSLYDDGSAESKKIV